MKRKRKSPADGSANGARAKPRLQVRREVSAGGLIWRRRERDGALEMVLVRPAGKDTWVLPKGHVEAGEAIVEAALREANEESGLEVVAGEPLGEVSYVYSWRDRGETSIRIFKRVHFFLMQCTGGNPGDHDHEIDEVRWLSFDQALSRSSHKSERNLILKAREILRA